VPTTWVDVDDDRALRILLADNRSTRAGHDDQEALAALLKEILGESETLEGTGYSGEDLDALLQVLDQEPTVQVLAPVEGLTDEDAVPEPQPDPFTLPGDIWLLGDHRLMCGDSTSVDAVERLMAGAKADMVFTDPPYNVNYDPESRHSHFSETRTANPLGKIQNDKKSPEQFRAFLDDVYSAADCVLIAGGAIYICHADTEGHHFRNAFIAQPWKLQSCLIWKKTVLVFGRADYHWMHEPILYGWKEGASHSWEGDRKQTTIIQVASEHYDKAESDTGGKYVHPTQKPVKLILIALQNSSRTGSAVLDLFGGSGSTLIACEKTRRKSRLMEIDPRYCDVIINRWQEFTGREALLEGDGRSFAAIKSERFLVKLGAQDEIKEEILA
jgi:DNA modification methylase